MTITTFDIALPIALGVLFGLFRYMERNKAGVADARALSIKDAVTGILGMAAMTVILKYFSIL